jgi:senataxin
MFSPEILEGFWAGYDAWDVKQILKEFERLGVTPTKPGSVIHSLSDVPPPLALRVMSNWAVFSDKQVQKIIYSIPPHTAFQEWPTISIPPGVLALLMEQTPAMRQWATAQALGYPSTPLSSEDFTGGHVSALKMIVYGLTFRDSSSLHSEQFSFFHFALHAFDLWAGFSTVLRFLPVEYIKANNKSMIDVRKIVSRHLSDTDTREYFVVVPRIYTH